jgi:hypothetical protein
MCRTLVQAAELADVLSEVPAEVLAKVLANVLLGVVVRVLLGVVVRVLVRVLLEEASTPQMRSEIDQDLDDHRLWMLARQRDVTRTRYATRHLQWRRLLLSEQWRWRKV